MGYAKNIKAELVEHDDRRKVLKLTVRFEHGGVGYIATYFETTGGKDWWRKISLFLDEPSFKDGKVNIPQVYHEIITLNEYGYTGEINDELRNAMDEAVEVVYKSARKAFEA